MFVRVDVECARRGISLKGLATETNIKYDTILRKLNGKSEFTRSEMLKIKNAFGGNIPLEDLFSTNSSLGRGQ